MIPRPIVSNMCQFSWIFLLCNNGEEVSSEYDTIGDAFFECAWYMFPIKLQNVMPTILIYAQEDVQMAGLGGLPCTRDTFKQVFSLSKV